ncbi:MAG: Amidohydrolase [Deltaproteobacteria bacterium]|nr:Amidohydrolase [Deltaproteobacteria bacterium]
MPTTKAIIDADAHVFEPDDIWLRYLAAPLGDIVARTPGLENGNSTGNDGPPSRFPLGFVTSTGRQDLLQLAADAGARLKVMDSEGIDKVALFPTHALRLGGVRHPEHAPALFRAYNDWLADHCAMNKDRLLGVAMIPLQEPKLAVQEATRAVATLGHRGLFISPHPVDERNLDHPAYEPLWDLAEQLNVPALVHVSTGIRLPTAGADRFDRYCFFHLHAHPMEQMSAAASLILGGVLERHPRLRVGFMEAGCGWVPYWLERMDEHVENYRFEVPYLKARPSDYFRRQCFVSFELEERAIPYVAETVGAETLVFASDFPHHDCFYPGAVEKISKRPDLDAKLVAAMLSDNPRRLYFGV